MAQKIKYIPKPSKKELAKQAQIAHTMNVCEAVKMITFYVLRNQGWGATRLKRFSDNWNQYLMDVAEGRFTLTDISDVLTLETGLTVEDLMIPGELTPANSILSGDGA